MKIALCLVGELRGFLYSFDSIRLAFPTAQIDVYASLWERDREVLTNNTLTDAVESANCNLISSNVYADSYFSDKDLQKKLINNFGGLRIGPAPASFIQPNIFSIRVIKKSCHAYNSIENKEQYDYIINARYDLRYFFDIEPLIEKLDDSTFFTTTTNMMRANKELIFIWDGFCGGTRKAMETYYSVESWMEDYYQNKNGKTTDERLWYKYLIVNRKKNILRIPGCVAIQHNKDLWYNHTNVGDQKVSEKISKQKFANYNFMYTKFLKNEHPELFESEYERLGLKEFDI